MAKYNDELKQRAIAIAQTAGPAEASKATGIPAGTIRSWLHRLQRNDKTLQHSATQRPGKKMRQLQEEAVERAVQQAGEYIAERLKGLADNLYSLAEKSIGKIDVAISDPDELPKGKQGEAHDRDGAAWLRSLVGVLSQSIDKAQLLSGKPTTRPEVTQRYEYDVTQRIITAQPELIDTIFTENKRSGMENWSSQSTHSRMGIICGPNIPEG